jgi:hypothetical protein
VLSWSTYVALGDSLTADRDDHEPGGARIGWTAILPLPAGLVALAGQRMSAASEAIREQAAARGALCLDAWAMPAAGLLLAT